MHLFTSVSVYWAFFEALGIKKKSQEATVSSPKTQITIIE